MLSLLLYATLSQTAVTAGNANSASKVYGQKIDAQLIVSDFLQQRVMLSPTGAIKTHVQGQ